MKSWSNRHSIDICRECLYNSEKKTEKYDFPQSCLEPSVDSKKYSLSRPPVVLALELAGKVCTINCRDYTGFIIPIGK